MLNIDVSKLKDIEVEIYRYILKNKEKVVYMTIRELAEEVHVSTATILRFCKIIGCTGFSEFKSKLKLSTEKQDSNGMIEDTSLEELYERTLKSDLHERINECSEIINEFNNVIFVGSGSSKFIAQYGANYLSNFGKLAFCIQNDFYPLTSNKLNDHVCIALSVSGETQNVIRVVKMLQNQGVPTIGITNSKTSTLSKLCDYSICYYISKESRYDDPEQGLTYRDFTTQLPSLYILEQISRKIGRMRQGVTEM